MAPTKRRSNSPIWRYLLLILLMSLAAANYTIIALSVWHGWSSDDRMYRVPMSLKPGTRTVERIHDEVTGVRVEPGDELVSIDGKEVLGLLDLTKLKNADAMLQVKRGGQMVSLRTPMQPLGLNVSSFEDRLITVFTGLAMPALCFALGGLAVAIRIHDPQAWMLLALMLTFPNIVRSEAEVSSQAAVLFSTLYQQLMVMGLPAAITIFGIYFGERWREDIRRPWLKHILLIPSVASGAIIMLIQTIRMFDLRAAAWLQTLQAPVGRTFAVCLFISICAFFAVMNMKRATTSNADVKRRLRLLLAGTEVSMLPLFFLIIASLLLKRPVLSVAPAWAFTAAVVLLFLFPATITYVIVVHRALDLRVVIRQGIQYALARGGANLLVGLLIAGVLIWMVNTVDDPGLRPVDRYGAVGAAAFGIAIIHRLRLRIAAWVDRKFFRQAYDTERVLSDLAEQVRTIVDPNALVETVSRSISDTLYVPRLAFLLADGSSYRPAFTLGIQDLDSVQFPEQAATVQHLKEAQAPARVYLDDQNNWVWRTSQMTDQEREMLQRLESQLILPLAVKEKLLGFISLGQKKSEEPYSGSDLRLLRTLAAQSALALENSRLASAFANEAAQREKLNRELEIAREVQERLFPQKTPDVQGIDCAGGCRPALGVGGDYYDFLALPGGKLGIVIGDVSGKGIAAALLMASLQASVRGQIIHTGRTLAEMIAYINSLMYEASTSSRYATLFYGQLDPKTLEFEYVNAGHNPPLLMRATGEVERLEVGGTVVGLLPRFPFRQGRVQLRPDDLLVAFTDGVSEAENSAQEEWGEERLIEAIRASGEQSARELIPFLIEQADRFAAGAPQHDDMTLVIVRVRQAPTLH
jgi:sigma-B regulation protein RsbU (phosphoserine phosphatase)